MSDKQLPHLVAEKLGYYVYLYINPEDHEIFYVGKGIGNRVYDHLSDLSATTELSDTMERNKIRIISNFKQKDMEPQIEMLSYSLDEKRLKF